jgi:hypothetical protein
MSAMNPLCPNCLNEMSKAAASRNLFNCEPCREIIQFFGVRADRDSAEWRIKPSEDATRPIKNVRAA